MKVMNFLWLILCLSLFNTEAFAFMAHPVNHNAVKSGQDDLLYWTKSRLKAATALGEYIRPDAVQKGVYKEGSPVEPADVNKAPFWNGGKLYFTSGGTDHYCTAQFVDNPGVLLTAARCLINLKGVESQHIIFVQQNGQTKYAKKCFATSPGWPKPDGALENTRDYAFIKVFGKSTYPPLKLFRDGVYKSGARIRAIGFPTNYSYRDVMYTTTGVFGSDKFGSWMTGNPMSAGAIGGAWTVQRTSEKGEELHYVVGLTAFSFPELESAKAYGPLLTKETQKVYQYVLNDCSAEIRNREGISIKKALF